MEGEREGTPVVFLLYRVQRFTLRSPIVPIQDYRTREKPWSSDEDRGCYKGRGPRTTKPSGDLRQIRTLRLTISPFS